jgi:hypothetical protein
MVKTTSFLSMVLSALIIGKSGAQDSTEVSLTTLSSASQPYVLNPPLDCNASTTDFANAVNSVRGTVSVGVTALVDMYPPTGKLFTAVRMIIKPDEDCVYSTSFVASLNASRKLYQDGPANSLCYDFNDLGESISLPSTETLTVYFSNENIGDAACFVDAHFDFEFEDAPVIPDNGGDGGDDGDDGSDDGGNGDDQTDDNSGDEEPCIVESIGNSTCNVEAGNETLPDAISEQREINNSVRASGRGPSAIPNVANKLNSAIFFTIICSLFGIIYY